MSDPIAAVQRYLDTWNADADDRRRHLAEGWTEDAGYTDPLLAVRGREAIDAAIGQVRQQFPGHEFRLTGSPDAHHDRVRFAWELVSRADSSAPVAGFDVLVVDETGRVRDVSGFLDRIPG